MAIKRFFYAIHIFISITIKAEYPLSFVEDGKIINELETQEYCDIIRPFLPKNPTILEAGCHDGEDTVILAKNWPLGHVYAFEPVSKFFDFARNKILEHQVRNATITPYALSAKTGEQTFYLSKKIDGASSLLKSNDEMNEICNYQDETITVNCVNLDQWASENNVRNIDFMWLDMEGAEYFMLDSAPNILSTVSAIITEVNFREFRVGTTQYQDLLKLLSNKGFTLYKIWGSPIWQGTALFIRTELLNR